MKKRQGFVSNSSSSSFIVPTKALSAKEISKIKAHDSVALSDSWYVREEEDSLDNSFLIGSTDMDNFDMTGYMRKVGVDMNYTQWSEYPIEPDEYNVFLLQELKEKTVNSPSYCPHCGERL